MSALLTPLMLVMLVATPVAQEDGAEADYEKGIELYNAGDYEAAVASLEKAARLRSNVADYRYHLGLAYLKVGKAREASRELEAALGMMGMTRETRVQEPMVLVELAVAYLRQGDGKTARKRIDSAIERGEDSAEAHYVRGLVESEEGNEEGAVAELRLALERDRDHPAANVALANRLAAEGKLDEARECLRHASHAEEGSPESYEILMSLGELAFRQGDLAEAEEAYLAARNLRPEDEEATYNLGTVLLGEGKPAEAAKVLEPLAERATPQDDAAFNFAEALRQSKEPAKARDVLRALLEREPEYPGARFALALVLESLDDLAGAESAYRRILDEEPHGGDELSVLLNLSALLERADRGEEALPLLKRALALPMSQEQEDTVREAIRILEERKSPSPR